MSHPTPNLPCPSPRCRGIIGRELLAGLVVALICGGLWVVVAHYAKQEMVYLTLAIGVVVGITVSAVAKKRSADAGISAATLTLIVTLLGKLLIIQWSITSGAGAFGPPQAVTDARTHQADPADTDTQAETQIVEEPELTADDQRALMDADTDAVPRSFWIKTALSNKDLLWIVGAIALAFITGCGLTSSKAPVKEEEASSEAADATAPPADPAPAQEDEQAESKDQA